MMALARPSNRATRCQDLVCSLFTGLDTAHALVLAVSGGPDSMALMQLAARWAGERNTPRLHVATVDHGLRAEAAAEAAFVADAAARLGLAHAKLVWVTPKPQTRVQERAREARYALLTGHAHAVGATAVLTAHHADDQAETVLMRLGRGSGLAGLAGMRRVTPLAPDIDLVRPLLAIAKADLVALCHRIGQTFCDDPSNGNLAYARARLRAQRGAADALGLGTANLCRLAQRMARAEAGLDAASWRLERDLAPSCRAGLWAAQMAPARDAAPELLQRVVRRAILAVLGPRDIRLDRLETLTDALHASVRDRRPLRASLAGARIELTGEGRVSIAAEAPRHRGNPRARRDEPANALRPN